VTEMVPQKNPTVGDRVRIERDESRYPSKGTWPQFRGRTGTIVEINVDRKRPHLTEYGVVFGKVSARTDGRGAFNHQDIVTWFKDYEMVRVAPERHADGEGSACPIGGQGDKVQAAEAQAFAARMAVASRDATKAKNRARDATLRELVKTVPLTDEARERICELIGGGADGS
jgi:hypothetical protein